MWEIKAFAIRVIRHLMEILNHRSVDLWDFNWRDALRQPQFDT